jgi:hypothetical protein
MTKKPGRPPLPTSDRTIGERVKYLIEVLFRGNQGRASDALGLAQTYISKIMRGERNPGTKLLDALARIPRVNETWLLSGEGEPMLPSSGGTLPISVAIIPGPLESNMHFCGGERHPVAATQERDTRYWLRVQTAFSGRLCRDMRMFPGDLLQIETAGDHIHRPDIVMHHLCTVLAIKDDKEHYALARFNSVGNVLQASLFDDRLPDTLNVTDDLRRDIGQPSLGPKLGIPDSNQTSNERAGGVANKAEERRSDTETISGSNYLAGTKRPRRAIGKLRTPEEKQKSLDSFQSKRDWEHVTSQASSKNGIHRIVGVVLRLERPSLLLPFHGDSDL